MLDEEFFQCLEFEITKALQFSENADIKGFWCDGIIHKESESLFLNKTVNDKRQLLLKVYIGKDGQLEYELTLKFGKKSLSRYARNLDLKDCIPNPEIPNFFDINNDLNIIKIELA